MARVTAPSETSPPAARGRSCRGRRDRPDGLTGRGGAATAYEMPFPCSESWTGTTRPSHSPSRYSIDWNRTDDIGDAVVAAAAGVVSTAEPNGTRGYGRYVVIDHGNGESSLYGHLSSVAVWLGQVVDQGQLLFGTVGDTGNATGPHLHFEERLNGKDPRAILPRRGVRLRQHPAVPELPRRPAGGQLHRRRHRRAGPLRPGHRYLPVSQPAGRVSSPSALGIDRRSSGTGMAMAWSLGVRRSSERTSTSHFVERPAAADGQPHDSRSPATGPATTSRRRGAQGRRTCSGCASPPATPSRPSARPATSRSPATGTATGSPTSASTKSPRRASPCV